MHKTTDICSSTIPRHIDHLQLKLRHSCHSYQENKEVVDFIYAADFTFLTLQPYDFMKGFIFFGISVFHFQGCIQTTCLVSVRLGTSLCARGWWKSAISTYRNTLWKCQGQRSFWHYHPLTSLNSCRETNSTSTARNR